MKTLETINKEVRTINKKFDSTYEKAQSLLLIGMPIILMLTTISLYI